MLIFIYALALPTAAAAPAARGSRPMFLKSLLQLLLPVLDVEVKLLDFEIDQSTRPA